MNVWDRTGIELATPGSAVRHASVARHVTDCATWPGLDEMLHYAAFHLGLHCLYKFSFRGFPNTKG